MIGIPGVIGIPPEKSSPLCSQNACICAICCCCICSIFAMRDCIWLARCSESLIMLSHRRPSAKKTTKSTIAPMKPCSSASASAISGGSLQTHGTRK